MLFLFCPLIEFTSLTATLFQDQFEFGWESVHFTFEYLTGLRRKEECVKKFIPQLVLSCMVDNFLMYNLPLQGQ
jgi:hypothetical protein